MLGAANPITSNLELSVLPARCNDSIGRMEQKTKPPHCQSLENLLYRLSQSHPAFTGGAGFIFRKKKFPVSACTVKRLWLCVMTQLAKTRVRLHWAPYLCRLYCKGNKESFSSHLLQTSILLRPPPSSQPSAVVALGAPAVFTLCTLHLTDRWEWTHV